MTLLAGVTIVDGLVTFMAENEAKTPEKEHADERIEVAISYFKSNFFRVVHSDGAWGGISPQGNIHMAFYSERPAIPDVSRMVISRATSELIKPEEYEATSKIVREMEVDVVLDLRTAIQLRTWLDGKITALQKIIEGAQQEKKTDGEAIHP
jgi:hypothetical protein